MSKKIVATGLMDPANAAGQLTAGDVQLRESDVFRTGETAVGLALYKVISEAIFGQPPL